MKTYISIHDVSPNNFKNIEGIISILKNKFKIYKIGILVVPGLHWNQNQINKLKSWQNHGIEIAAHGWQHQSQSKKSLYHKIHSIIISGNCAEHLSKNKEDVIKIINNSYNWFIKKGFNTPKLYVPPGWALGKISALDLNKLPFSYFECTTGLIHKNKYYFLPLVGFEETTYFRSIIRRFFNSFNYIMAYLTGFLRIAIHPNDFNLLLKTDLNKYLSKKYRQILLHELN